MTGCAPFSRAKNLSNFRNIWNDCKKGRLLREGWVCDACGKSGQRAAGHLLALTLSLGFLRFAYSRSNSHIAENRVLWHRKTMFWLPSTVVPSLSSTLGWSRGKLIQITGTPTSATTDLVWDGVQEALILKSILDESNVHLELRYKTGTCWGKPGQGKEMFPAIAVNLRAAWRFCTPRKWSGEEHSHSWFWPLVT